MSKHGARQMSEQALSTVGIRSEVRRDGTLHLSLQSAALNNPGLDEVVVKMVAAPLHPADISMLLGPAHLALRHSHNSLAAMTTL